MWVSYGVHVESCEDPDLGATHKSDAVNPGKSRARWEATHGWGSSARSSDRRDGKGRDGKGSDGKGRDGKGRSSRSPDRRDHKGGKGHKGGGGAAAP